MRHRFPTWRGAPILGPREREPVPADPGCSIWCSSTGWSTSPMTPRPAMMINGQFSLQGGCAGIAFPRPCVFTAVESILPECSQMNDASCQWPFGLARPFPPVHPGGNGRQRRSYLQAGGVPDMDWPTGQGGVPAIGPGCA